MNLTNNLILILILILKFSFFSNLIIYNGFFGTNQKEPPPNFS